MFLPIHQYLTILVAYSVDVAKKRLEEELNEERNQNEEVISRISDVHTREIEQWNEKYESLSQKYEDFFTINATSRVVDNKNAAFNAKETDDLKISDNAKTELIKKLESEKKELALTIEIMKNESEKNDYSDSALQASLISAKLGHKHIAIFTILSS